MHSVIHDNRAIEKSKSIFKYECNTECIASLKQQSQLNERKATQNLRPPMISIIGKENRFPKYNNPLGIIHSQSHSLYKLYVT